VLYVITKVDPMNGKAQIGFCNESRVGEARVHPRRLVMDRFVIWEVGIGERHKQSTEKKY
jgi:hypothetical protein